MKKKQKDTKEDERRRREHAEVMGIKHSLKTELYLRPDVTVRL